MQEVGTEMLKREGRGENMEKILNSKCGLCRGAT